MIAGLSEAAALPDVTVYHAATAVHGHDIVTAGGRVLAVSALGAHFAAARERAYGALARISFAGMQSRPTSPRAPCAPRPARSTSSPRDWAELGGRTASAAGRVGLAAAAVFVAVADPHLHVRLGSLGADATSTSGTWLAASDGP